MIGDNITNYKRGKVATERNSGPDMTVVSAAVLTAQTVNPLSLGLPLVSR